MDLHCYLVTYDISDPKRWRKVFRTVQGFGEHVQLSVFRCDLTEVQRVRLRNALDGIIHHEEDQVVIAKLGRSTPDVLGGIEVLGRPRKFELPASVVV